MGLVWKGHIGRCGEPAPKKSVSTLYDYDFMFKGGPDADVQKHYNTLPAHMIVHKTLDASKSVGITNVYSKCLTSPYRLLIVVVE